MDEDSRFERLGGALEGGRRGRGRGGTDDKGRKSSSVAVSLVVSLIACAEREGEEEARRGLFDDDDEVVEVD